MLKISILDTPKRRRLVVEGKLAGPWTAELRNECRKAAETANGRELLIDVRGVTEISEDGKCVLLELMNKGAKFRSSGVFTKQILKRLACRIREDVRKKGK